MHYTPVKNLNLGNKGALAATLIVEKFLLIRKY